VAQDRILCVRSPPDDGDNTVAHAVNLKLPINILSPKQIQTIRVVETEKLGTPTCVVHQTEPIHCGSHSEGPAALKRCLTELRTGSQEHANGQVLCAAESIAVAAGILANDAPVHSVHVHTNEQTAGPFQGHVFTNETIEALRDTGTADGMLAVCACNIAGCGCTLGEVREGICQIAFEFRACGLHTVHIGNWRLSAQ
jgi:hypothetical protein